MIARQFKKSLCRRNSHAYTCAVEFEGNVQEVGYRLKAWTIALGHESLIKGRLENVNGNRMRIYLTSKSLQELGHAYNELCRPENIPKTADVMSIRQIDANGVKTLDAERVTDILMLEQQSKGVDYLKALIEHLSSMNKDLSGKLDDLPVRISEKLADKFDAVPDKIGRKLDELPDKIAKAIKTA